MIIIPDIHGRTFWKDAVNQRKDNEKIIFLGDYIDPYPGEMDNGVQITHESALKNFKEILKFAKENDNVILLLGNHDFGPYISSHITGCRTNRKDIDAIRELYNSNMDMFDVLHYDNGYCFSHAIFHKRWVDDCKNYLLCDPLFTNEDDNIQHAIKTINNALHNDIKKLCKILDVISSYRGGFGSYGSCIWGDIREGYLKDWGDDIFMVVGHTQLKKEYINMKCNIACLDCRRAFRLENGNFEPITDER